MIAIFTNDDRFEDFQNQFIKREDLTMCEVLDKIVSQGEARGEARGKFNAIYNFIKKGRMTIEEAASDLGMTVEQLLADF